MQKKDTTPRQQRSPVLAVPSRQRQPRSRKAQPPPSEQKKARQPPSAEEMERFSEGRLDLNRYLIKHPAAPYFVRVKGDSMMSVIHPGDILVLDRVVECGDGDIGIFRIGDELIVKRLNTRDGRTWLVPENPAYEPLEIEDVMDFEIWGKVLHVIRTLQPEVS